MRLAGRAGAALRPIAANIIRQLIAQAMPKGVPTSWYLAVEGRWQPPAHQRGAREWRACASS
jgi:hypothetical protein